MMTFEDYMACVCVGVLAVFVALLIGLCYKIPELGWMLFFVLIVCPIVGWAILKLLGATL